MIAIVLITIVLITIVNGIINFCLRFFQKPIYVSFCQVGNEISNIVNYRYIAVERIVINNMTEVARLLLGLRSARWTEKEINDFVLYIESGEGQYKLKPREDK